MASKKERETREKKRGERERKGRKRTRRLGQGIHTREKERERDTLQGQNEPRGMDVCSPRHVSTHSGFMLYT